MRVDRSVVVLLGGGVESTQLVRLFLDAGQTVIPVHVHTGLLWDEAEIGWVRRFCAQSKSPRLRPLIEISLSLRGFLGEHWAVTGRDVPRAGDSSARLEIPLRNLTLLGFALHAAKRSGEPFDLALGTTADNHYPDGSREYFDACEQVLSLEAGWPLRIETPLIGLTKSQVIQQADAATLAASFSCVDPRDGLPCGRCIKCGRRREAFAAAGVPDPTRYE